MQKCAEEIHGEAHLHIKSRPSTDVGGAQAHLGSDHAKAVASRHHLGAGAPGMRPHPCYCHLGPASTEYAWRHAMAVLAGFLIYQHQTDHVVTI